jgi:hypothetical protein
MPTEKVGFEYQISLPFETVEIHGASFKSVKGQKESACQLSKQITPKVSNTSHYK